MVYNVHCRYILQMMQAITVVMDKWGAFRELLVAAVTHGEEWENTLTQVIDCLQESSVCKADYPEWQLKRDPEWAGKYSEQIHDMEAMDVARKLGRDEMNNWTGPVFHLSHLAVEQPKTSSTPVRIVSNSSQL